MKKMKMSSSMKRNMWICIVAIAFLIALCGAGLVFYTTQSTEVVEVISVTAQQHVSGSEGSVTSYFTYYVATDRGMYRVKPDGLYATRVFGTLQQGQTYRIRTRGFTWPLFGQYPYIIEAELL